METLFRFVILPHMSERSFLFSTCGMPLFRVPVPFCTPFVVCLFLDLLFYVLLAASKYRVVFHQTYALVELAQACNLDYDGANIVYFADLSDYLSDKIDIIEYGIKDKLWTRCIAPS